MVSIDAEIADRLQRAGFILSDWPTVGPDGSAIHRVNVLGEPGRIEVAAPTRDEAFARALAEASELVDLETPATRNDELAGELARAGFAVEVRFTSAVDGMPRYDLWGRGPLGGFFILASSEAEALRLGLDHVRHHLIPDPLEHWASP